MNAIIFIVLISIIMAIVVFFYRNIYKANAKEAKDVVKKKMNE